MNKQNQLLADYVYLAEASYTDFSKSDDAYKELKGAINESFAKLVTDNYTVLAHWKDRAMGIVDLPSKESGFSATLFQNNHAKDEKDKYVLAIKGSFETKDYAVADIADIVHDGLAHHQIIDLYNFWQQITSPASEKGYIVAVAETDYALTAAYKASVGWVLAPTRLNMTNNAPIFQAA